MDYSDLADHVSPWLHIGDGTACRYRFFEEGLFWERAITQADIPTPRSGSRNARFIRYDSIARVRLRLNDDLCGPYLTLITLPADQTRGTIEEMTFPAQDGHDVYEELLVRSLYARAEPPAPPLGPQFSFIGEPSTLIPVPLTTYPMNLIDVRLPSEHFTPARCPVTGGGSNLQCLKLAGHAGSHFVFEANNLPYEWNSVALDEGQLETGIVIRTKGCPSTFIPPGHPGFPYPCSLEPGHDGPHRAGEHRLNGVGLRWTGTGISARSIVCDAYHEVPAGGFLGCEHDDGHDGLHVDRHGNTWPDADEFVPEGAGLVDRSGECGHSNGVISTGVPGFGICILPIGHIGPHADAFKNTWSRI